MADDSAFEELLDVNRHAIEQAQGYTSESKKDRMIQHLAAQLDLSTLALASGVLGVPTDQVRAETLDDLADEWGAFEPNWKLSQMDYWVRARAAEYRKAAGA